MGVLALVFVMTPSTRAVPPDRFEITFTGTDTLECGTFTLVEDFTGKTTVTLFYDNEGNLVRRTLHRAYDGVIVNPTNGKTADDVANWYVTFEYPGPTHTVVGGFTKVTIPGYGIVWQDTGRVIMTVPSDPSSIVFEAGPHEWRHWDITALCEAMA